MEEAGEIEAGEAMNPLTKSNGKIKNVSISIRRDIYQLAAQMHKGNLTTHIVNLGPANQKV